MHSIYVQTIEHEKAFDVINVMLLFWPGSKISDCPGNADIKLVSAIQKISNEKYKISARIRCQNSYFTCQRTKIAKNDNDLLRHIKQTVFLAAQKATGICPPWGIMTGIRPMSIYEKLETNYGKQVGEILENKFFVTKEKREILDQIFEFRKSVYYDGVANDVSLYVSIPFCPSKCAYCSFVSSSVEKVQHLISPYLTLLCEEIRQKINLIHSVGKRISTVYIGGGTPGILSAEQINILLSVIRSCITEPLKEFCFELGRPETVTAEKLTVLKKQGIDRICINCQTLNDEVLNIIGRRHTVKEFTDALTLAGDFKFNTINVDFIAGLPGENIQSHLSSIQKVIDFGVENITVHTLSIKRASTWNKPGKLYAPSSERASSMLSGGYKLLRSNDYFPYYIYRQKSTVSNGENIGYAKMGHIGMYNIYMMEDVHTVIGCGAGASTKIIHPDSGRIDRFVNTKYPQEYIKFSEKVQENTSKIFENLKGTI